MNRNILDCKVSDDIKQCLFILLVNIVEEQKKQNVHLINKHELAVTAANQKVFIADI